MKTQNCHLSANTIIKARRAQDARLAIEREKCSTAERYSYSMKQAETIIRHEVYSAGIRSTNDFRARAANKTDLFLFIEGKRHAAEVKCGGTVGVPKQDGTFDEQDILPGCAYVIVPVITEIEDDEDLLDNSAILTRAEFLEIAAQASRKGLQGTFHVTGGGKRSVVIAYQPTPLSKVRAMIKEGIDHCEYLTVRSYIEERE